MSSQEQGSTGNPALIEIIEREIERTGPITFARFMELALYHPVHGYYLSQERGPGRAGDFLTAPEATAYFGLTLARQVAECWERLGRPQPFEIREYGSGAGVLAYDVIAGLSDANPAILDHLRYRLVEINRHRLEQSIASMAEVGLGDVVVAEELQGDTSPEPITGVVIANEVADAFPAHRLIARSGELRERYLLWRDGRFSEEQGPLSIGALHIPAYFARHGIEIVDGAAYDVSPAAATWFGSACHGLERGYAITIDYGYPVNTLFRGHRLDGTMRGYFEHTVTDDPLINVGHQDLTIHVDFTALQEAAETTGMQIAGFTIQAAFLASLGLGERLVTLQHDPDASFADYASAQAVVLRLIDPGGLGRFGVLMMARDAPVDPPLLGMSIKPPPF